MDREAKEYQAPSLQRPAVPIYQELRVEIMLGEDRKKAGQLVEEGPALEGSHHRAKHRDPLDPPRNTSNKTCKGLEPGRRFKAKRGPSHPPSPRPDTRDGRPGHRAHNQAEDWPNPQFHKPRA